VIGGEVVMAARRILTFDTESMIGEIRDMARSLRRRNADLFAVATAIAEFVP
jgi:hypothetical protein